MPANRHPNAEDASSDAEDPSGSRRAPARESLQDHARQPDARLNDARQFAAIGDLPAAVHECEQVLREDHAQGADPRLRAAALNQLACLHRARGEFAKAAVLQRHSLAADLNDPTAPEIVTDLGNLAADAIAAGDLPLARELLRRSLSLETSAGSLAGQAADIGNLALVHALGGDQRAAIRCLRHSLHLHRHAQDVRGIGCDLLNLAAIYETQRRWARAIRLLNVALRVFHLADARDLVATARRTLARTRRMSGLREYDASRN